jgi:antitoxin ParD1/3/4
MAKVEKLSIALTPEMAAEVRDAVNSGQYASSSEVIREALREWRRQRVFQEQSVHELRRQWQAGVASGPGRHSDMDEIKQAARERLAENNKPS